MLVEEHGFTERVVHKDGGQHGLTALSMVVSGGGLEKTERALPLLRYIFPFSFTNTIQLVFSVSHLLK